MIMNGAVPQRHGGLDYSSRVEVIEIVRMIIVKNSDFFLQDNNR